MSRYWHHGGVLRVGLSGGIGSGKSTVARRFQGCGAVVIDADVLAREVVRSGTSGLEALVTRFGPEILDDQGELDRSAMARRVFGDDSARADLNAIVHPRVAERTADLMAVAARDAIVVHDMPLLVENAYTPNYHLVVIVNAPTEDRVRRLAERGLDETDARARIQAQATEEQRREAADVWLDNDGSVGELIQRVDGLWTQRLVPFEANVRAGRPASESGAVLEPTPDWAREARRLTSRIEKAVGTRARRVDHVGATSVPGLLTRDVVDLQVTVSTREDADTVVEPLGEAGFPVETGRLPTHVFAGETKGPERVHASADPGRCARVRIWTANNPGWRYALLLRDWLRADSGARDDYRRSKNAMVGSSDEQQYAEAKAAWFAEALPRAEQWASRTGWQPPLPG